MFLRAGGDLYGVLTGISGVVSAFDGLNTPITANVLTFSHTITNIRLLLCDIPYT